jgi:hypothetical protein
MNVLLVDGVHSDCLLYDDMKNADCRQVANIELVQHHVETDRFSRLEPVDMHVESNR